MQVTDNKDHAFIRNRGGNTRDDLNIYCPQSQKAH